jgi:hypothetical protein
LSSEFSGIKVAYLGTQRDLGVIFEVFNGLPDGQQKPDATLPLASHSGPLDRLPTRDSPAVIHKIRGQSM